MDFILEKEFCTGCEACSNICTHQAINMIRDDEGFDYPVINQKKCIDCGLCKQVCPVIHYDERQQYRHNYNDVQKAFAAKTINTVLRKISSSGGIFPTIATYILGHKGIVVGAAFDNSFNVYHKIVRTEDKLTDVQSSKYAQSKIGDVYKEVKKELISGKMVLFAGMACQIEGLKSFLRKEYFNLYTIDLICMGVPSPGVWQKYLQIFFKYKKIKNINFKDKTYGWRTFAIRIETNKSVFLQKGFDNIFFQCMFKHYTLRPSCFNCPYKKEERLSDFTLADCWGTVNEVPQLDDNQGLSSVIVHSRKGFELWEKISDNLNQSAVSIESIAKNNDNLVHNCKVNNDRQDFYRQFNISPRKTIIKYGRPKRKSMIYMVKLIIKKVLSR